ncbi:ATP-binding protein [Zunongwangia sp. HGR-M22]|uniref:ATP-binding protein n=1 Tax=Zunongwangia sp. HGR-M22 TaxID=3015168 RepID=UPI0022DE2384|nr:ATP-binding protein [Zunongwangia sp. HGR-M22]WBL25723.1 ATP-binding protein [Zunongwangia sp. HGR-M22]
MIETKVRRPLMGTANILDLQNNGYKNSVYAIAEIIDNSIQAGADNIDVIIVNNTNKSSSTISELLIVDNGEGMDRNTFDKALMMNSGTRGGAKKGLGKYGQGLPNASISQTQRVEVYTKKDSKLLYNYIDLNEIHLTQEPYLPEVEESNSIDIELFHKTDYKLSNTGTIVRWVDPNNIRPKTIRLLVENINRLAGRIFRYYLSGFQSNNEQLTKTKLNVLVYDFNGKNYDLNLAQSIREVKPFDPMFLMPNTQMEDEFKNFNHPTNKLLGRIEEKEFEIEIPNSHNQLEKVKTKVEIAFSHVKLEERYRETIHNPGDTSFGKTYKKRNIPFTRGYNNISIVRANREIDNGDYGFIGDVSDQTLRWWSVEIKTEPVLDTIIGIDNKKQQASNIKFLDADEENDSHEILTWISETISNNISTLKKEINSQYHQINNKEKGGKKGDIDKTPIGPTEPGHDEKPEEKPTDKNKQFLYDWIKERYESLTSKEIESRVNWALSISDKYIFVYSDLGETDLYSFTNIPGIATLIEINYNHPFYIYFISKLEDDTSKPENLKKLRSIRLLICSLVKAEISNKSDDRNITKYLKKFKNTLSISLDDYIEDLFIE